MKQQKRSSFRAIRDEITRRIGEGNWAPGSLIPGEEMLAQEFGAARATVNRALQELARRGMIERKRKVGTRVALNPLREARFVIPVVRDEIAARGEAYGYRLVSRAVAAAGLREAALLDIEPGAEIMHLKCLHFADGRPYEFEDRLINLVAAPAARKESFEAAGPNEWLVNNVPFSRGEYAFMAAAANEEEARMLGVEPASPVFVGERRTWLLRQQITFVRRAHPPSHRLTTAM